MSNSNFSLQRKENMIKFLMDGIFYIINGTSLDEGCNMQWILKHFTAFNCRSLNSNHFSGQVPPSIGNLSNLLWLDLTNNQLDGPIPVSKGSTPGLDMLFNCRHLYVNSTLFVIWAYLLFSSYDYFIQI